MQALTIAVDGKDSITHTWTLYDNSAKKTAQRRASLSAKLVLKMRQTIDGFVCTTTNDNRFFVPHIEEDALK